MTSWTSVRSSHGFVKTSATNDPTHQRNQRNQRRDGLKSWRDQERWCHELRCSRPATLDRLDARCELTWLLLLLLSLKAAIFHTSAFESPLAALRRSGSCEVANSPRAQTGRGFFLLLHLAIKSRNTQLKTSTSKNCATAIYVVGDS